VHPESAMSGDEGAKADNTTELESSGQGVDRPRRRERKRNGDRQTLSVVRHFVSETQDGRIQMGKRQEAAVDGEKETKNQQRQQWTETHSDHQR
jgi:hypothetical protein